MKPSLLPLLGSLGAVLLLGSARSLPAAPAPAADSLPAETRGLLDGYEKIRAALAADNFRDAQAGAAQLAEAAARPETPAPGQELAAPAAGVAKTTEIKAAREAFKPLSATAIRLAAGTPGFVVIHCPMTPNGDWLQTNAKVSNPYYGRTMIECGVVKK